MARLDRLVIGIFGRINAGKSTLMNLLTQQETSIVDSHPGTTADIKSSIMEIHSLGPVRILDTAGLDEISDLGGKKRQKAMTALGEVDIVLLVIDPVQAFLSMQLVVEQLVSSMSAVKNKKLIIIFNIHSDAQILLKNSAATLHEAKEFCRTILPDRINTAFLSLDLSAKNEYLQIVDFIKEKKPESKPAIPLLPFLKSDNPVLMHIPLDEESPTGRLLRPQEMTMEFLLRMMVPIGLYRTDLTLARSASTALSGRERQKFTKFLTSLQNADSEIQLVITDSQAIDVMSKWVPKNIPLTTFSIMMINQTADGKLDIFTEGTKALDTLTSNSRVLIVEACNHDRVAEDIGTVQIPEKFRTKFPGITINHSFGREFPPKDELQNYDVVIHCGGCMISRQKLAARLEQLSEVQIPLTNYGLVLSWFSGAEVLQRVLKPWKTHS